MTPVQHNAQTVTATAYIKKMTQTTQGEEINI